MMRCKDVFRPGTMMNRAFHIWIVLAVAAHMLCGCCLHHAHAYGAPSDPEPSAVEASCPCDHESPGAGQSCDNTSQHQPCDGERCVFTRPDTNSFPDLSIGSDGLDRVYISPCILTPSGIARVDSSLGKMGAPIALHLLNQVILL